jgi:hypothetical protein
MQKGQKQLTALLPVQELFLGGSDCVCVLLVMETSALCKPSKHPAI